MTEPDLTIDYQRVGYGFIQKEKLIVDLLTKGLTVKELGSVFNMSDEDIHAITNTDSNFRGRCNCCGKVGGLGLVYCGDCSKKIKK